MWPYMIRVNPTALTVFIITCIAIYLLYSSSIGSSNKHDFRMNNDHLVLNNINLKKLLIASVKAAQLGGHEVVKVRKSNKLNEKSKGKTREGVNDMLTEGDVRSHWQMVHGIAAAFPGLKIVSEEKPDDRYDFEITPIYVKQYDLHESEFSHLPNIQVPLKDLMVWIDPLDATKEYTENLVQYVTTMVCVTQNNEPIIGVIHKPFDDVTYWSWTNDGTSFTSDNLKSPFRDANPNANANANANSSLRVIVSRSHSGDVHQMMESAFGKSATLLTAAGAGYKIIELIKNNVDAYVHITDIKKWDICAPNALINAIQKGKLTKTNGDPIDYGSGNAIIKKGILATLKDEDHNRLLNAIAKSKALK